ncbi:hypothetical protein FPV67DRAFT_1505213, partial [Lyophyllum atratum]
HTNPTLRSRITAFQTHLFHPGAHPDGTKKATIRGLDKSIVIDPMRFHLTLGPNAPPPGPSHPSTSPAPTSPPLDEHRNPPQPPRTVTTALALLRSLGPQIDAILSGGIPRPSTTGTTDSRSTRWTSCAPSSSDRRNLHAERSFLRLQPTNPTIHSQL